MHSVGSPPRLGSIALQEPTRIRQSRSLLAYPLPQSPRTSAPPTQTHLFHEELEGRARDDLFTRYPSGFLGQRPTTPVFTAPAPKLASPPTKTNRKHSHALERSCERAQRRLEEERRPRPWFTASSVNPPSRACLPPIRENSSPTTCWGVAALRLPEPRCRLAKGSVRSSSDRETCGVGDLCCLISVFTDLANDQRCFAWRGACGDDLARPHACTVWPRGPSRWARPARWLLPGACPNACRETAAHTPNPEWPLRATRRVCSSLSGSDPSIHVAEACCTHPRLAKPGLAKQALACWRGEVTQLASWARRSSPVPTKRAVLFSPLRGP
jgi:hypothetical protein